MPPRNLNKRQREALDPDKMVENIPTMGEGIKNLMSSLLPQRNGAESAVPQGNRNLDNRQSEFGRYNQPMLGEVDTGGLTEAQIRQAQAEDRAKTAAETKQKALETYLEEQKRAQQTRDLQEDLSFTDRVMGRTPELAPADINEQIALDRAIKTNPALAEPENKSRFLKAIREKMRQQK